MHTPEEKVALAEKWKAHNAAKNSVPIVLPSTEEFYEGEWGPKFLLDRKDCKIVRIAPNIGDGLPTGDTATFRAATSQFLEDAWRHVLAFHTWPSDFEKWFQQGYVS